MRYTLVLMIASLPVAWGQAQPNHFNCPGGGVFPCQAQSVTLPATGKLTVSAVNASVFVETWDTPEILVRADVGGSAGTGIAVTNPGTISVRGKASSLVHLIIELPASTDLTISTVNGGTFLHGVTGNVTANAVNGGVSIVVGGQWAGQSLVVDAVNGDIAVAVPADCSAKVTASAQGGTVSGDFPGQSTPGTGWSGFDFGGSVIVLSTVKGDIKLWTEN